MINKITKACVLFLRSIWFNFHYLPFEQAIKLPIFIYKINVLSAKGKIIIDTDHVERGMIKLGFYGCSLYPNSGVTYENHGGTIIFKGKCRIGNNSALSIGDKAVVVFGDDFHVTSSLKLVSYRRIEFGKGTRFGWDCLIMDTNFHPLYDMEKKCFKRASGPIKIGDYNWFSTGCRIMHSVETPERCIWGMNTIVTRNTVKEPFCIMGGSPVRVLSRNVMRILGQDVETYD